MQDASLPSEKSSQQSPGRQSLGTAPVLAIGLIAILAIGAAVYFWRGQQTAASQRAAAQAQATLAERHFKDVKAAIDGIVSGLSASLAKVSGLRADSAHSVLSTVEGAIDKLVKQADNDRDIRRSQGSMYVQFADTYMRLGDAKLAVADARKGTEIFRALAAQYPNDNELRSNIGLSLEKVGEALHANGDINGSRAAYRDSLETARALADKDPRNKQWRTDIVLALWRLADVGDDPRDRLIEALKMLQTLKLQAALSPDQEGWIAMIERDITNLK